MSETNRIFHVDGDSFFASCEIALDRKLEGRPVWVGGGRRGDGIVTAEAQRAIDLLQERRTALISAAVTGQIDGRPLAEKKAA